MVRDVTVISLRLLSSLLVLFCLDFFYLWLSFFHACH